MVERDARIKDDASPTVFIVDDNASIRRGLTALLESAGFATRSYASGGEFLDEYRTGLPGCLILDLRLRGESGFSVQEELDRREATLPIIFLTAHGTIDSSVRAMKGGAAEFLRKPAPPEEILAVVREALERDRETREANRDRLAVERRLSRLTPRERTVLDEILEARTSKEIARGLGISFRTVEGHRRMILSKMDVSTVAELLREVLPVLRPSAAANSGAERNHPRRSS